MRPDIAAALEKRQAKKAWKAQNAAFIAATEALARPGISPGASNTCSEGQDTPKRARGILKRSRPKSIKAQIKAIKKRILGTGGIWSQAVRKRDDHKCVMCGKTETLQAHHWLFRRAHSLATAVEIGNGITLCYGCHMGRIHHDGDGDFILRLAEKMTEKIGVPEVERLRELARVSGGSLGLDWWQETEARLKGAL